MQLAEQQLDPDPGVPVNQPGKELRTVVRIVSRRPGVRIARARKTAFNRCITRVESSTMFRYARASSLRQARSLPA